MNRAQQTIEKASMARPSLWIIAFALLALGFMSLLSTPAMAQQPELKPPVFEESETDEKTSRTIVINVFAEVEEGKSTGSFSWIQVDDKPKLLRGDDGKFDWKAFGKQLAEAKANKEKANAEVNEENILQANLRIDSRVHYKHAAEVMKIVVKQGIKKVNLVAKAE